MCAQVLIPLARCRRHTHPSPIVTPYQDRWVGNRQTHELSFESLQGAAQACTFAHVGMWPCNHGVQGLAFAFSPQMASIPYFSLLVGKKYLHSGS